MMIAVTHTLRAAHLWRCLVARVDGIKKTCGGAEHDVRAEHLPRPSPAPPRATHARFAVEGSCSPRTWKRDRHIELHGHA